MASQDDMDKMLSTKETQSSSSATNQLFEDALEDALCQCLLMPDFIQATSRWFMASRLAQMMGAPDDMVRKYGNKLVAYFNQRNNQSVGQLILDNHGTIN